MRLQTLRRFDLDTGIGDTSSLAMRLLSWHKADDDEVYLRILVVDHVRYLNISRVLLQDLELGGHADYAKLVQHEDLFSLNWSYGEVHANANA